MSLRGNFATEERHGWIRERLEKEGEVRIRLAAEELQVSEMTIRRDLQEMEALGEVRRVRGGAVAVGPVAFAERHRSRARAKSRLAAKLIDLVPSSGAIGIDASSTLLRLATLVAGARDLQVLTNGPETFTALQGKPGVDALLTGGALESRTGSLVGPMALRSAGSLLLKRLFLSAAGVDVELGPSEACLEEAEVKRTLASTAAEVVLCVDATKLDTRSVARTIEWDHITLLITELDPKDSRLDPYRAVVDIL